MPNFCSPEPMLGPIFSGLLSPPAPKDPLQSLTCMAPLSVRQSPWNGPLPFHPPTMEPDVSFLFRMCLNPKLGLDQNAYENAAKALDVEVNAIKAVAEVETQGNAFDEEGRPRILYERHYFHHLTHGRFDKSHPKVSSATRGGYGKFSIQYKKLEEAYALDPSAALKSASWGRFQIMGRYFQAAGFSSVQLFVLSLSRSEENHLVAFTNFVKADKGANKALRKKDWATFASHYNGPGYKDNKYDTKLAEAYKKLSAEPKPK